MLLCNGVGRCFLSWGMNWGGRGGGRGRGADSVLILASSVSFQTGRHPPGSYATVLVCNLYVQHVFLACICGVNDRLLEKKKLEQNFFAITIPKLVHQLGIKKICH